MQQWSSGPGGSGAWGQLSGVGGRVTALTCPPSPAVQFFTNQALGMQSSVYQKRRADQKRRAAWFQVVREHSWGRGQVNQTSQPASVVFPQFTAHRTAS